jgi:tubulin--tyrosine ligase
MEPVPPMSRLHILLDYKDDYVEPIIRRALSEALPSGSPTHLSSISALPDSSNPLLQFRQYEELDFDHLMRHSKTSLANSYVFRKALIRKNYLPSLLQHWFAKHPESFLKAHVKTGEAFELDYAEFLDDALVECWDLRESLVQNAERPPFQRDWWILKPGMSDRGQGIKLFSTEEDLRAIFERWEEQASDSEDSDIPMDADDSQASPDNEKEYVVTSHLRHFIAQPYIHPCLTFESRKFHIRTYVVCIGALRVYVSKEMLALFASEQYLPPWENPVATSFLTNTCLQQDVNGPSSGSVKRFWDLPLPILSSGKQVGWKENVFQQICTITGELFTAAARGNAMDFQPLPNAFEIFGIDFLVDTQWNTWLLEVNAFPDFGQTGPSLRETVISPLMKAVVKTAILPFFGLEETTRSESNRAESLVKVADLDLGKT